MKKLLLLALILIMIGSVIGCAATPNNSSVSPSVAQTTGGAYQEIKPESVKKMLDDGDTFVLVDVRTVEEYESANIQGAINIPVETITDKRPTELPDLNAMIIIYCRSGARSEVAANALLELGYTQVYDMGGIIDWPYDTVVASTTTPSAAVSPTASEPSASTPSASSTADGVLSVFTATDINGNSVDAAIFNGYKLTMVNVWATFCSPCIEEMPDLGKLNAQYTDKGFQIVGIIADAADGDGVIVEDMVDLAKEIVDTTGADYLHLLPSADINKLLLNQIMYVPTTIFVDANGNQVGEEYVGSHSREEWTAIIDGLLKEVN